MLTPFPAPISFSLVVLAEESRWNPGDLASVLGSGIFLQPGLQQEAPTCCLLFTDSGFSCLEMELVAGHSGSLGEAEVGGSLEPKRLRLR